MLGALAGILLVAAPAFADSPSAACLRAAATAERRFGLPVHLLVAIGTVESGRLDPATGRRLPWPWSANAGGTGYVFSAAQEASNVVGWLQGHGIASIDVGCFQVNLHYHPDAFASLAQGFDPAANADYAGRFLRTLYARTGSWETAIADYHSADPVLGGVYRAQVMRAWANLGGAVPAGDPHVVLVGASAAAIPVYTPATLPPSLRAALGLPPLRGAPQS